MFFIVHNLKNDHQNVNGNITLYSDIYEHVDKKHTDIQTNNDFTDDTLGRQGFKAELISETGM